MKRLVICMLAGVLFAGSVLVVGKVQGMNNEETQESQSQSEENIRQEAQEPDSVFETEVEEKVAIETDTQTEVETEETEPAAKAPAKAKAKAKAEASAQMKVEEAKMSDETLIQEESPSENAVVEVNRRYIEDCGSDSGYWEITYSDGHIEYLDE